MVFISIKQYVKRTVVLGMTHLCQYWMFNEFIFTTSNSYRNIYVFFPILYVVFGQITVRKLRKNPDTKNTLGVKFASGWDTINIAQALAIPRSWAKKIENSPLSALYAKSEFLLNNTTRFDRILAVIFYWLFTVSGISMIVLVALNSLGLFN